MFNFLIWSVLREEYTRSHLKNVDQDPGHGLKGLVLS